MPYMQQTARERHLARTRFDLAQNTLTTSWFFRNYALLILAITLCHTSLQYISNLVFVHCP